MFLLLYFVPLLLLALLFMFCACVSFPAFIGLLCLPCCLLYSLFCEEEDDFKDPWLEPDKPKKGKGKGKRREEEAEQPGSLEFLALERNHQFVNLA